MSKLVLYPVVMTYHWWESLESPVDSGVRCNTHIVLGGSPEMRVLITDLNQGRWAAYRTWYIDTRFTDYFDSVEECFAAVLVIES